MENEYTSEPAQELTARAQINFLREIIRLSHKDKNTAAERYTGNKTGTGYNDKLRADDAYSFNKFDRSFLGDTIQAKRDVSKAFGSSSL
ncbi:hypothetical protein TL16_g04285 [Triparma laevis f. inornata]|uniref:Uncharacterized protein n=2 Tax=Triparma laevis TaxID=1534972 RepID=A0A9W6ZPW3_9STRA|nr:hypothetical protein TrLO_g11417 [Triparma laevis f. longispina]GMH65809.1 hypothetical protein TL16_g04285 [Triparma laevis f. inornata]